MDTLSEHQDDDTKRPIWHYWIAAIIGSWGAFGIVAFFIFVLLP